MSTMESFAFILDPKRPHLLRKMKEKSTQELSVTVATIPYVGPGSSVWNAQTMIYAQCVKIKESMHITD